MKTPIRAFGAAVLACAALTACDDTDDPTGPPDGEAAFEVVLRSESNTPLPTGTMRSVVSGPLLARLSLDGVSAITVPIGAVQARSSGGAWVEAGSVDADINLLDLPDDGVTLVDSSLPEGTYTGLRFFLDGDATITLEEDVMVGRALFEAGTHPLRIPSADQTGLKLNAEFVVDEDGQILTVLFDEDATVSHVTATGSGVLMIAPVLRVVNQDGEDIGENDDDDEDEEAEVEFEGLVTASSATGFTLSDGTNVVIDSDTEIEGDILTLAALALVLANDEVVEAEGEGVLDADGETVIATKVEFETDDDDGDGDPDDDDEEVEVEGSVTGVNRADVTFTVEDDGVTTTVVVTSETEIDDDGDFTDFDSMADAFDAGTAIEAEAEGHLDADGRLIATDVEFEIREEAGFEGTLVGIDPGDDVDALTVDLEGGGQVVVLVTADTQIDAGGDLTVMDAVFAAFDAGTAIEVEGSGTVDSEGRIVADVIRFETD